MNGGNESVHAMSLGISLIFFSVLLGVVGMNAIIGKNALTKSTEVIELSDELTVSAGFRPFLGDPVKLPAAGAYAFITYNTKDICQIICKVPDQKDEVVYEVEKSYLKKNLTGFVDVNVKLDKELMEYIVYVTYP